MKKHLRIIYNDSLRVNENVDLSPLEGKTLLLTGASGLLGVYFISSIITFNKTTDNPVKVYAVIHNDLNNAFYDLFNNENLNLLKGDLTEIDFCRKIPRADFIIHAAGYGQPRKFLEDPIKTLELSTSVTLSLFKKLNPDGKFLFISTAEVYSGLVSQYHTEKDIGRTNTTHYRSCYIEGKRSGEAICNAYRSVGVSAKSARLALAYGPGTRPGDKRVINNFIEKAISGKMDMLDKGDAERTYCYVQDAVEIMWNVLLYGQKPIYNVGGKSKTTIRNLADEIGRILDVPVIVPLNNMKSIKGAPSNVSLDMSLSEREFNKFEYVPLADGLKRTIEWQKYIYKNKGKCNQ